MVLHTICQPSSPARLISNSRDSTRAESTKTSLGSQMLQKHVEQPKWAPWSLCESRVLKFQSHSEHDFSTGIEFRDSKSLDSDLLQLSHGSQIASSRFVYILEGLSEGFVDILQQHFRIHMALFKDHERLVPHGDRPTGEAGGIPFLPSAVTGREYTTLKYHEPVVLSCRPDSFRNLCNISGRHIAATRLLGSFSNVATLRRKCTFWSRPTESGGWICP